VTAPDQWKWSSFRAYWSGERGAVRVNYQEWPLKIKACPVEKCGGWRRPQHPLIRKVHE